MLGTYIAMSCMHAVYQTVNSRSKANGIIIGGAFGSILEAKRQVLLSSAKVAVVEPSGTYAR